MDRRRFVRQRVPLSLLIAILGLFLAPSLASANALEGLLNNVGNAVNTLLGNPPAPGGGAAPAPAAPAPSTSGSGGGSVALQTPGSGGYTPPLHGTNPHAQGTATAIDVTPSTALPQAGDVTGAANGVDVVVGGSRADQAGGQFHGHISVLALFGQELIGVDTDQGEVAHGPLQSIQALLNDICASSGNQVCLTILQADSATTATGSINTFAVATANVLGIQLGALQSNANLNVTGGCMSAQSTSSVANANLFGALTANAVDSASNSLACDNGTQSQINNSHVVALNGAGLPLPVTGCDNGTPNSVFQLLGIASTVCHANESNDGQAPAQQGAREGLTAFVAELLFPDSLASVVTAGSESRAVAPGTTSGPPGGGGGDNDNDNDGVPNGQDNCPNVPGPASNQGCPTGGGPGDQDGDGVPDGQDNCPTVPGPASNQGCPTGGGPGDQDGDGIPDDEDACPTVPGPASNDGCPLGGAGGPSAGEAGAGGGNLAFTGADVLGIGLAGIALLCAGLALQPVIRRRIGTTA